MDDFFKQYVAAFLSLDPANVSDLYNFPVTFFAETGEVVIFKQEGFLENSKKLFAIYIELGVSDIDFQIIDQEKTNELFELVSVKWSFIDADGAELYSATSRYLVQTEDMKIVAVTTVDEMRKINELLKK